MEVPGAGSQLVEDVSFEGGKIPSRALETIHELIFAEPVNGAGGGGERGDQDQSGGIRSIRVSIGMVDLFDFSVPAVSHTGNLCLRANRPTPPM